MARSAGGGLRFTLLGRSQVERVLEELPAKSAKKVLRQAMRKAMKPVAAQVKANAPVRSGATRKAVKVRAAKVGRKALGIDVTVGAGDYKGDTFAAAFVEYGTGERTKASTGQAVGRVEARRFMHRAFEQKKDQARKLADSEAAAGMRRELAALAEKGTPRAP